jgi:hypothetical protein
VTDWLFIGILLLIASVTLLRRQMVARMQERTGDKLPRFLLETEILGKYRRLFGVDRLYVSSQVSTHRFFALMTFWILWNSRAFR